MAEGGQDQSPERSLDVISNIAEFEESLRRNREFIVKNLNVMNLLINPISFKDIISEDEQGSIRLCYESNMTEKAAKMFIDAILRSNDETKLGVFKDALHWGDGLELIKEILCKGETKSLINHEADQAQVNLQRGRLAHQWDAELVANGLRAEEMLTGQEFEEVMAKLRNHSNCAANIHILFLIIRKKGFLAKLVKVLWNLDKKKCVRQMGEHFYTKMVAESGSTSTLRNVVDPLDCDNSNENAIAVNYMEHDSLACDKGNYSLYDEKGYENNNKKMINNANKMGHYNVCNSDTQDDNEPVASRTRSKTKLQQMKENDETLLKQPVLDYRLSGTSHKEMKTLPTEQVVKQYPVSYSSAASKQFVQQKDAPTDARLQEDNKQTNLIQMKDPDETLLKQPVLDYRPSGTSHKQMKTLPTEQVVKQYPVSYSSAASKQFVQQKDVPTDARLQEDNKQTNLIQMKDPDETLLKQPVMDHRPPDTSQIPREILPAEQAVIQHPMYYSSGASDVHMNCTCVQFNGAILEARFQEENKQTQLTQLKYPHETVATLPAFDQRQPGALEKPRETLPAQQVVTQHPISHPSAAIRKCVQGKDTVVKAKLQENKKQTQHEVRLVVCVCNKRFISEDALKKHQSTDCQVTFGHDNDETSPLPSRANCATLRTSVPEKPRETLPAEQVVTQHPISHPNGAIRKCVQGKDTVVKARLQENKKQTQHEVRLVVCVCNKRFISEDALRKHQRTDCQVTFGHDNDKTSPLPSRANCATLRTSPKSREYSGDKTERQKNKLLPAIKNVKRCTCGRQFISQEALDKHISFDCKDSQTVPEDTMSRSFDETQHPLTKTKSKQQTFPSRHINADNEKPRQYEVRESQRGHSDGATNSAPQNRIPHNDQTNDQILNTEHEETHPNSGDIGFTQQMASVRGFGFQSSRTLQLHKKP